MKKNYNIAIVASTFNEEITDNLIKGAELEASNSKSNISLSKYYVPGAFEIPGVVSKILRSKTKFNAIITFGCVIKGETAHFEYISNAVSNEIMSFSTSDSVDIPVMFGVLTTYNYKQALTRSKKSGNEIMKSTLDTIKLYETII